MKNKKIGIIGAGHMGSAIIGGIYKKYHVTVCDVDQKKCQSLRRKYKVKTADLESLIKDSDIILLAVKPQTFDALLKEIRPLLVGSPLFISIAAGITTKYIEKRLGKGVRVIRTMPNLPAQVGEGMTGICAGIQAEKADLINACQIFSSIGQWVVVKEKMLDADTAVSGSGPAYVFYFVEGLMESAKSLGLKKEVSRELVWQTLKGSIALLASQKESAGTLRKRVTSKGGTTEAALQVLENAKIKRVFNDALKTAAKRAKELSQ